MKTKNVPEVLKWKINPAFFYDRGFPNWGEGGSRFFLTASLTKNRICTTLWIFRTSFLKKVVEKQVSMFFKSIFSQGNESSNLFIGWERLPCKGNSHQAEKRQVLHRHQIRLSPWRSRHWGHPFWRWISWILGRNYTYEPGIYGGKKVEWCEVLTITMVNFLR